MLVDYRLTAPTILTLSRLVLSPIIMPLLISVVPTSMGYYNIICAVCFGLLSITDFLDGFLARCYNQVTSLGGLLDHLADKFLIFSTVITLVHLNRLYLLWAIVIIGREFFVMGLREIALFYGFHIPVTYLGKLKTLLQMLYITVLLLNSGHSNLILLPLTENILLAATLFSTLLSAVSYANHFITQWKFVRPLTR